MPFLRNSPSSNAASANLSTGSTGVQSLWDAAHELWTSVRDAQAQRRRVSRTAAELEGLDDMMLADLGISRCAIPAIAAHPDDHQRMH